MFSPQFQCYEYGSAKWEPVPDNRFQATIKLHKERNGCDKAKTFLPTPFHQYHSIKFKRCPCAFYNPEISTLIEYARIYEQFGPKPLLYMYKTNDISAKLYSAIKIVLNYLNELKLKQMEAAEKKQQQSQKPKKAARR